MTHICSFISHCRFDPRIGGVFAAFLLFLCLTEISVGQEAANAGSFPVGERITYSITMEKFQNVAYAETFVVSTGRVAERDAVEIRTRLKTVSFASAAFYLIDETRTTYAAVDTGLPIFIRRIDLTSGLPTEKEIDLASSPPNGHDLATLIYAIRKSGSSGSLMLEENGKPYQVTFQTSGGGKVSTDAGDFDTVNLTIQSSFFSDRGISNVSLDLANNAERIPVRFRFRTDKGEFTATVSSIQNIVPDPDTTPTPTPTPVSTPRPTPTPAPTPRPYLPNRPLPADLAFVLGERIRMRISSGGENIGTITFRAAERTLHQGRDTLLLTATVTEAAPNQTNFRVNDTIWVRVDPETVSPQFFENRFSGSLASLNQSGTFDPATSAITVQGIGRIDAPFGTHTVLSLLYAMRSFNLKPSIDTSSPVNDTRVAVFWNDRTSVFQLRPSDSEVIRLNGERTTGQLITINTQMPQLDALSPKIWLGNDARRLPLRIILGNYQLDLIDSIIEVPR